MDNLVMCGSRLSAHIKESKYPKKNKKSFLSTLSFPIPLTQSPPPPLGQTRRRHVAVWGVAAAQASPRTAADKLQSLHLAPLFLSLALSPWSKL